MKNNFKKVMSVLLVALMICSIFSISVSAVARTVTLKGGSRKLNGETYTATLNETLLNLSGNTYTDADGVVYTIDKENHTITFVTGDDGYFNFPEHFFVLEGHEQAGWCNSATSNSGNYATGRRLKITSNKTYYARYNTAKYTAEFLPGEFGEGASQTVSNKTYGQSVDVPGAIFTRAGFVQIGWATVDGSEVIEYDLGGSFDIKKNIQLYPVWQRVVLNISHDINKVTFGSICEGYVAPEAQILNINNLGNADVTVVLPVSESFTVVANGSTTIKANGSLSVSIQPKAGLPVGSYLEALSFDFGDEEVNFSVTAKFVVNEHLFIKYVSNGDATYSADGTETAECFSGCGAKHTRTAAGSMKIYSVDNNTADGLLKEYLYHKTVKFVAYGSGMDAAEGDNLAKRFRPAEWSVNDTAFGGEFTAADAYSAKDYTVMYDHGDGNFGTYTLTIKYVEEEKNADGEWVATGIEDVKNFNYSIGPSEKDNQEVVRPNMIVSIIFGLFGYLIDLLTSGSLF